MKLKWKSLLALTISWTILIAFFFIGSQSFLLNSFKNLEQKYAQKNLDRAKNSITNLVKGLERFNLDWAHWDHTYEFTQKRNKSYIKSNITTAVFEDSGLNLMMFYNKDGKLVLSRFFNPKKSEFVSFPKQLQKKLGPTQMLVNHKNINSRISGIIRVPEGYFMVSSLPVLNSEKNGPSQGALVMGKRLDSAELLKLSKSLKLSVEILSPDMSEDKKEAIEFQAIAKKLQSTNKDYIVPHDENTVKGYSLLRDINNNPIAISKVKMQRDIMVEGKKAIKTYLIAFITMAIINLFLIWSLINRLVIRRVEKLSKQIFSIDQGGKFSTRVSVSGKDEIYKMAGSVNAMLEVIEESHSELEDRVKSRTEELNNAVKNLRDEVSQRRSAEEALLQNKKKLEELVWNDSLTGLPNRLFFNKSLSGALAKAKRENNYVAIYFIDIDRFKNINDTRAC